VSALDVATVAVLAFVGVRIAGGTRIALSGKGRQRVVDIARGLRPVHFGLAVPVIVLVVTAVVLLVQIPGLDWGWWTALGGFGNPVTGGTERTTGTPLEWIVPLVFVVLLLPALPLFAEAEERMFRLGAERRSRWGRVGRSVQFGLAHALIGIPIGAALGLSVGGQYFTWRYMREFRRTGNDAAAMLESTRAHLTYNLVVVTIVALAFLAGTN
jgi:ABC-type Fe3+ transport system permease subunit